jgi:hypothetical protein
MLVSIFGLKLDSTGRTLGRHVGTKCLKRFGGPGEIRTLDLFHAMEQASVWSTAFLPAGGFSTVNLIQGGLKKR